MNEIGFAVPAAAVSRPESVSPAESRLWPALRAEAARAAAREEMLRGLLDRTVLRQDSFAAALGELLAHKLADPSLPAERLVDLAHSAMAARSDDRRRGRGRSRRDPRPRPRRRELSDAVSLLQGLSRAAMAPHRPLAVASRPARPRPFPAKPRVRGFCGRHPSRRAGRQRRVYRPRHRTRRRRDRGHRQRRVDPARGDLGRHRQGARRPPSQRSATGSCCAPAPRCWAMSRSAARPRSAPAASC